MCTTVGLPFESAFAPDAAFELSFHLETERREEDLSEEDIIDGGTMRRRSDGVTVETKVQGLKERANSTEIKNLESLLIELVIGQLDCPITSLNNGSLKSIRIKSMGR